MEPGGMEGAGKVAWGVQDRISGFWLWGGGRDDG